MQCTWSVYAIVSYYYMWFCCLFPWLLQENKVTVGVHLVSALRVPLLYCCIDCRTRRMLPCFDYYKVLLYYFFWTIYEYYCYRLIRVGTTAYGRRQQHLGPVVKSGWSHVLVYMCANKKEKDKNRYCMKSFVHTAKQTNSLVRCSFRKKKWSLHDSVVYVERLQLLRDQSNSTGEAPLVLILYSCR